MIWSSDTSSEISDAWSEVQIHHLKFQMHDLKFRYIIWNFSYIIWNFRCMIWSSDTSSEISDAWYEVQIHHLKFQMYMYNLEFRYIIWNFIYMIWNFRCMIWSSDTWSEISDASSEVQIHNLKFQMHHLTFRCVIWKFRCITWSSDAWSEISDTWSQVLAGFQTEPLQPMHGLNVRCINYNPNAKSDPKYTFLHAASEIWNFMFMWPWGLELYIKRTSCMLHFYQHVYVNPSFPLACCLIASTNGARWAEVHFDVTYDACHKNFQCDKLRDHTGVNRHAASRPAEQLWAQNTEEYGKYQKFRDHRRITWHYIKICVIVS